MTKHQDDMDGIEYEHFLCKKKNGLYQEAVKNYWDFLFVKKGTMYDDMSIAEKLKAIMLRAAKNRGLESGWGTSPFKAALWRGINPWTKEPCNYIKIYDTLYIWDDALLSVFRWLILNYDEKDQPHIDKRQNLKAAKRWSVLRRDGYKCCVCGRSPQDVGITLHVDHRIAISRGGKNHIDNLWTLCSKCNLGKSDDFCPEIVKVDYLLDAPRDAYWYESRAPHSKHGVTIVPVISRSFTDQKSIIKQTKGRILNAIGMLFISLGEYISIRSSAARSARFEHGETP